MSTKEMVAATAGSKNDTKNGSKNDTAGQEARNAALEGADELVRRLGLRMLRQEPPEREAQMARTNPDLAERLSRWPDLILSAHDGQDNIHFVAVMTPEAPEAPDAQDVRDVRIAANLLHQATGRPAHAVIVEMTEGPEPDDESWNPVHWHTITRKGGRGTNDGPEKLE